MALTPLFRYASGAIAAGECCSQAVMPRSSQSRRCRSPLRPHQVLHEPHLTRACSRRPTACGTKVPARHFNHGKSWVLP